MDTNFAKAVLALILLVILGQLYGCSEPENRDPVAKFSYSTPTYINEDILFNSSPSSDPDGRIARVQWKFDDGSASSDASVVKRIGRLGNFAVSLTVTDDDGASATARAVIPVSERACNSNSSCWRALPKIWAKVAGIKWVNIAMAPSFKNLDPGWTSISNNTAIRAMSEWHWNSCAKIGFSYDLNLRSVGRARDGYNAVYAAPIDEFGGILAQTYTWHSGEYVTEVDVTVDSGEPWGINGESNKFDLQSVLTHEFGHVWGLDDLTDPSCMTETMFWSTDLGATFRRTMSCGDKRGVQTIYGYECRNLMDPSDILAGAEPPCPMNIVSGEE
ncbi:MAG: PKD domain-containing protein [Candidatus Krumholzibacteria bacterium]|nr:PKD domain-containing protein [Candidatus Krumholzibacteria bacterium]